MASGQMVRREDTEKLTYDIKTIDGRTVGAIMLGDDDQWWEVGGELRVWSMANDALQQLIAELRAPGDGPS